MNRLDYTDERIYPAVITLLNGQSILVRGPDDVPNNQPVQFVAIQVEIGND